MRTAYRTYPVLHEAPPPPDFTGAPCLGKAGEWDIDALGHDPAAIETARRRCRYDCPVLQACHTWTTKLANTPSTTPSGVVQAGKIWGYRGGPGRRRKRAA